MQARACIATLFLLVLLNGVKGKWDFSKESFQQAPLPLRRVMESGNLDLWSVYLPTKVDVVSEECSTAMTDMRDAFNSENITWAHKMTDSWGKRTDGATIGFTFYLGFYDECKSTTSPNNSYTGRYCKIKLQKITNSSTVKEHSTKNELFPLWGEPIEVQENIIHILNNSGIKKDTIVTYSTCMPDACTREDLETSLTEVLKDGDYALYLVDCNLDQASNSFSPGDIGYIALLSFLCFLLILASIIDIYIQKTDRKSLAKGGLRYLLPFSAYTNLQKLFHLNTESAPGTITCLHGMRVLSMTWVVCAHQASVTFVYSRDFVSMFKKMDGLAYQTYLNGFPSVDTFFFMSGFLMAYSVFREFERSRRFNLPLFYFHRMFRLIPPIALVCGLYATIVLFFMEGPISNMWFYWRNQCANGWWRDVIFIDNFAIRNSDAMCLGQCWYLGVDTQLYLIAPLILLPIMYKKTFGLVWLFILTLVSMIIPAAITYERNLPPASLLLDPAVSDVMFYRYSMPWCRAGPVIIGIWLGYFMQKQGKTRPNLEPWQVLSGWAVASMTGLMVVYGLWSYNVYPRKVDYDVMTAVLYGGLHRPAWAACLSWVVYACHYGYGGFVNDFLGHPIWQPMSRLTYSMYLIAMPLQYAIAYNAKVPYYFTHYNKVIETVGALVVAVIPSILVSITAESPIIGIEKLLFMRPVREERGKKKPDITHDGEENKAFDEITELSEKEVNEQVKTQPDATIVTSL